MDPIARYAAGLTSFPASRPAAAAEKASAIEPGSFRTSRTCQRRRSEGARRKGERHTCRDERVKQSVHVRVHEGAVALRRRRKQLLAMTVAAGSTVVAATPRRGVRNAP